MTNPSAEPILDIAHLGNIEILTPKPAESLEYFRDILGMEVVHAEGNSVYLRGYGEYAASTLKLTAAKAPGVGCISWRCSSPQALDRRAKAIKDAGLGITWTNGDFCRGPAFRFNDPEGHHCSLLTDYHCPYVLINLQTFLAPLAGLRPHRTGFTGLCLVLRRLQHLCLFSFPLSV